MTGFPTAFGLTICGIEELGAQCAAGPSHVLSILDPDWPVPAAFGGFAAHRRLELRFHDVIEDLPGTAPPRPGHVREILAFGRDLLAGPAPAAHLLVHCHAGVSRSTAAMALILAQALPDLPAGRILGEILRIRPQAWPNLRLLELGDALLGRRGEMVAAAGEVYRRQIALFPGLAEQMEQGRRGREVAVALGRRAASSAAQSPAGAAR
ncbi:tyrosine phosphatase family protein [Caldovatus aquaticus]|uniref:Protein-tyrosine-phosphatase n=1 Tax=Caldovatus aquaticus TaxID=2865671 RepID=A0ABS7F3J0_9PROT|nr:protein-tyrosine-phosphatase [Caldovatus aquaticus]MBW8269391.1 protein-tyrosine-phosphatase [Caldovatus aquaticus]